MKYYSERLNKFYDTPDACERAEFEAKEKENLEKIKKEREAALAKEKKEKEVAERKAAAEKVDAARKAVSEAYKNYTDKQKAFEKELEDFCTKYKSYHYTLENGEELPQLFNLPSVLDFFGNLFKF